MLQTVHDFIKQQETAFRTNRITVTDGFDFNAYEIIRLATLYKNSVFSTGKDDNKPFKNITRPLLNLQYRAEGFDVKDVMLFINDAYSYYKSFLVRKFHERWARQEELDTFIDEMVESYVDYGTVLVKKNQKTARPEVVPMLRMAFFDQTDILGGPVCEKHYFTPDKLREMASKGWQNIEEVITLAQPYRQAQGSEARKSETPAKYIEVYELHGTLPEWWVNKDANMGEEPKYVSQMHIVTFYKDQNSNDRGISLYSGKEKEFPYRVLLRDPIYGRAMGLGGAEELFEPQVWTNYDEIRMQGLLDAAAKIIFQTADATFSNRNRITDMENGEILVTEEGKRIEQISTTPVNMSLFERVASQWAQHAREMAGASEAMLGERPTAGTAFRLQAFNAQQAQMLHDYRRGKIAVFLDGIYRDWIIPYIAKEVSKGQDFLATLDHEELAQIADSIVTCESNKVILEKILSGEVIDPQQMDQYKQQVRESFVKGGSKKFVSILQGELADAPLDVQVSIKGKQKDLSGVVDTLSNIFKSLIANPAIIQEPTMGKIFNQILEASGLEPIDFAYQAPTGQMPQPAGQGNVAQGNLANMAMVQGDLGRLAKIPIA